MKVGPRGGNRAWCLPLSFGLNLDCQTFGSVTQPMQFRICVAHPLVQYSTVSVTLVQCSAWDCLASVRYLQCLSQRLYLPNFVMVRLPHSDA
jgi:hypothetical protein